MRRAFYRVRQLLRGLRPALSTDEAATVRALLSDRELALFLRMAPRDRRQAVDVMRWLRRHTEPSTALLQAALLHDAGKGPLRVRDRIAFVLLSAVSVRLLDRVAGEGGGRGRRALWVLHRHARLGAELLVAAGTSPRVVELVALHRESADGPVVGADDELRWLIVADDAC